MKPPICELCGKDFAKQLPQRGGMVKFANYRPLPDNRPGHPEGLAWFCGAHLDQAQALRELSLNEALKEMRKPGNKLAGFIHRLINHKKDE